MAGGLINCIPSPRRSKVSGIQLQTEDKMGARITACNAAYEQCVCAAFISYMHFFFVEWHAWA